MLFLGEFAQTFYFRLWNIEIICPRKSVSPGQPAATLENCYDGVAVEIPEQPAQFRDVAVIQQALYHVARVFGDIQIVWIDIPKKSTGGGRKFIHLEI